MIEVDVRSETVEKRLGYDFGRAYRTVRLPQAGAFVNAPKLDAAIKKHGTETLILAVKNQTK